MSQIVAFIDMFKAHREAEGLMWRVEPICEVLSCQCGIQISPSGYYAYKQRKPSRRELSDARLKELILDIWEENYCCWGVRKVWHALLRAGETVARCTVERLMRELGIRGRCRGKVKRTTIAGKNARCAEDLIRRNFRAPRPNTLWVAEYSDDAVIPIFA